MKTIQTTVAVFVFMSWLTLGAAAQEKDFSQAELGRLYKNAVEKLNDRSYRSTSVSTVQKNGAWIPERTETTVRTVVPPDREQIISVIETAAEVRRSEFVKIGRRRFFRAGNGAWRESSAPGSEAVGGGKSIAGDSPDTELTVKRTLHKGVSLNGRSVDHYETVTTAKTVLSGQTYTTILKAGVWLNADGLLIKSANEYHSDRYKISARTVAEYDYDPRIRIEVPAVASETQGFALAKSSVPLFLPAQ